METREPEYRVIVAGRGERRPLESRPGGHLLQGLFCLARAPERRALQEGAGPVHRTPLAEGGGHEVRACEQRDGGEAW